MNRCDVEVCQGSFCAASGGGELLAELLRLGGATPSGLTADGLLCVSGTGCAALCGLGPVVGLDGRAVFVEGPSAAARLLRRARRLARRAAGGILEPGGRTRA